MQEEGSDPDHSQLGPKNGSVRSAATLHPNLFPPMGLSRSGVCALTVQEEKCVTLEEKKI